MKRKNKECHMIICWKHDWDEKPRDIEVVEYERNNETPLIKSELEIMSTKISFVNVILAIIK